MSSNSLHETQENENKTYQGHVLGAIDDGCSDVSSLSNDSYRGCVFDRTSLNMSVPHPKEVSFFSSPRERRPGLMVPPWLPIDTTTRTEDSSEQNDMPQVNEALESRFPPVARKSRASLTNCHVRVFSSSNNNAALQVDNKTDNKNASSYSNDIVANHCRRVHERVPSLAFSIGSVVGQSTHLTVPTLVSSLSITTEGVSPQSKAAVLPQNATMQTANEQQQHPCCVWKKTGNKVFKQRFGRRRNLTDRMMNALGRVTTPIKKLCAGSRPKLAFQHSNGYLT